MKPAVVHGDGTYDGRNKEFAMDQEMFAILMSAKLEGRDAVLRAFREGVEAGRITEVK